MHKVVNRCGILSLVLIYGFLVPIFPSLHTHGGQMTDATGGTDLLVRSPGQHQEGNHQCDICTRPTFPSFPCDEPAGPFVPSLTDAVPTENTRTSGLIPWEPRRDRSPPPPGSSF